MGIVERNLKRFNADTRSMEFFGPIIGEGTSQLAHVSIDQADTLTLPTTPVVILAAPGSAYAVLPQLCVLRSRKPGGNYTNIDAAAVLTVQAAGGDVLVAELDEGTAGSTVTLLLATSADDIAAFPTSASVAGGANLLGTPSPLAALQGAITLSIDNGGSGDLTGGGAGNTLDVWLFYFLLTL